MPLLTLSQDLVGRIVSHCRSVYPKEACGLCAGKAGTVEKIYEIANLDSSPVSYMADPKEQFRAMKEMREAGNELLAIFHSHPGSPAYPSPRDVELAFYSDALYIIVGLSDFERPEIRAFEISERTIREVRLDIRQFPIP